MPVASGADKRRMRQVGGDQALELGDELMHALRRQIERKSLTATEPVALRHRTRETPGPSVPHRSDEERETVRTRQEAQRRQLPCAVKNSSGEGEVIVTRN